VARQHIISALDMGTDTIHCLVAEIDPNGRMDIIGHSRSRSRGIKRGVVVELAEAVKSIESAVEGAEKAAGFTISQVYVATTGEHLTSADTRGAVAVTRPDREVTDSDRTRVLEAAKAVGVSRGLELIHLVPRGFVLDHQQGIPNPVGLFGSRLEVDAHLVLGRISMVQNLRKAIEKAGLEFEPGGLVLEPLAASLGTITPEERQLGFAVVDLGGGITDIAIFRDRELYSTDFVPLGGEVVTNDIAVTLRVPLTEAERLKVAEGKADPALAVEGRSHEVISLTRDGQAQVSDYLLAQVIEARVQEIFGCVKECLEKANRGQNPLTGVVLTGGGARLPGIISVAESTLGLPVRLGVPMGISGPEDISGNPEWAAAVGLIYYGANRREVRPVHQRGSRFKEWLDRLWTRIQDYL